MFSTLLLTALTSIVSAASVQKRATLPPTFTITNLGQSYDTSFPNIERDGGGGGNINGINFAVFSDTSTVVNGVLTAFVSNSIAAVEYKDSNPLNLMDFGSNGNPYEFVPRQTNESNTGQYGVWPSTNIVQTSVATNGIAVYPVIYRNTSAGGGGTLLYNTLVTITTTAYGPVAVRTVPQLFYAGETQYGSFGMVKGIDGYIYLFGTSASPAAGLKLARVPESTLSNRETYTYWNGAAWTSTMPAKTDTASNILNYSGPYGYGPATGDIFWSNYYSTWVIVFFDAFVDGTFRMMYSTDATTFIGKWSAEIDLYTTTPATNSFNYAGHAYPTLDSTGTTLLLGWTVAGAYIDFAKVTFD